MKNKSLLELIEQNHQDNLKSIDYFCSDDSPIQNLTNWILSTDANPYLFVDSVFASK